MENNKNEQQYRSIEDRLRSCIKDKYGSLSQFSRATGVPLSSITTLMSRGLDTAKIGNLSKICDNLGISLEELRKGRIVRKNTPTQIVDYEQSMELENIIEELNQYLKNNTIKINGEYLTANEIENVVFSLEGIVNTLKTKKLKN